MPKKIDWNPIRENFIKSSLTYLQLASKYSVSRQSIERRAVDESWQSLRQAFRCQQSITVEETEKRDDDFDLDALLKKAITLSSNRIEAAQLRNFEGGVEALCKLAQAYGTLHPRPPVTIEEWADQGAAFSDKAEVLWQAIKDACARALAS
jgi:hypothetical protein